MKYAYLSLAMIMFGLFGLVFIVMFESITVDNESQYYVLKEAMEAAMIESVDLACYRNMEQCAGTIRISEQKFVENFTKRFARSVNGDVTDYEIEFYDIIEDPPKATVVIRGNSSTYTLSMNDDQASFSLVNNLSGILEVDEEWG